MNLINEIETKASADTGATVTLSSGQRDTAMKTWLHDSWSTAIERQRDDSDNGTTFTLVRADISWNPAGTNFSFTNKDSGFTWTTSTLDQTALGFNQIPGYTGNDWPLGFLRKILRPETCFPWENFNLANNIYSRYIVVVNNKIYRHLHDESVNPKVNRQRISAAKNAVKDYATAAYHTSVGNTSEATARTTAGNTTVDNNTGDY